jgi:hypothetical protein
MPWKELSYAAIVLIAGAIFSFLFAAIFNLWFEAKRAEYPLQNTFQALGSQGKLICGITGFFLGCLLTAWAIWKQSSRK